MERPKITVIVKEEIELVKMQHHLYKSKAHTQNIIIFILHLKKTTHFKCIQLD